MGEHVDIRPGHYARQSRTYDLTRGASPALVRVLVRHLGRGEGRTLLDVAGGTGNYGQALAARGFRVLVLDASPAMLAHAAKKLGPNGCVAGDVQRLPFRDRSVECAAFVHGLHLVEDPGGALGETRRVLRGGPLVVIDPTRDNASLFVQEYFGVVPPSDARPASEEVASWLKEAGFRRVVHEPVVYTDTVDGSLPALHTNALHLAGPAYLRNTTFWHALEEDARTRGLELLALDLRSGVLEERVKEHFRQAVVAGHETVFAAWP